MNEILPGGGMSKFLANGGSLPHIPPVEKTLTCVGTYKYDCTFLLGVSDWPYQGFKN